MSSDTITVPKAQFMEDVATYMQGKTVEVVLQQLQNDLRQYRLVESQQLQRKSRLLAKIPEMKKTLDVVNALQERQQSGDSDAITVDYELADNVFAKAKLQDVQTVNLYLGVGVITEYSLEEAKQLLSDNVKNAQDSLDVTSSNLDLLKDNITITEVSLARIFNYDVESRRAAGEAGAAKDR